jgi:hypothetical protein
MLHYTELLAGTGILSAPETGSAGLTWTSKLMKKLHETDEYRIVPILSG